MRLLLYILYRNREGRLRNANESDNDAGVQGSSVDREFRLHSFGNLFLSWPGTSMPKLIVSLSLAKSLQEFRLVDTAYSWPEPVRALHCVAHGKTLVVQEGNGMSLRQSTIVIIIANIIAAPLNPITRSIIRY
jgi:hypothetical protein